MNRTTVRDLPRRSGSPVLRRVSTSAAALVTLVVVAGCGGSGGASSSDEPLTRDNLVSTMKTAVKDEPSAHLSMQMTGAADVSAKGDIDYSGQSPSMQLTMSGMSASDMQMRVVDKIIYISAPPATPEGKFLKLDPSDPNNPMGGQLDDLLQQADPMSSFKGWDQGLKSLKYVGPEKVGGETLDHYTVVIDTAKAMKAAGQDVPAGMPPSLTYQLFLDSADLMRKVSFDLGQVAMTIKVDQWGEPVDVQTPPKSDIVEAPAG